MTKVKVIGAYVNGHGPGSLIDVDEKSAKYLERVGYGEIKKVDEPKADEKKPTKAKAKPKAKTKAKDKE